ncbi:Alcohol acetyltransferase [Metarhizium acridum]|uniref:Alcohol acetyltransferase n=1 Tax=Metarhizium acridum TaxID=92637 RepID=UPI001C6B9DC0|nr:Alcohol acetyltransferase [Metarhizium acridum]
MAKMLHLEKLRPLGKLEQVSASCHHLGFFNNIGFSAYYTLSESICPAGFDLRRVIYSAARDVIRKHGVLFAIPVNEDTPESYFASLPSVDLDRSIYFLQRSLPVAAGPEDKDKELDAILEDQHNTNFKSDYGTLPFWRLVILQTPGVDTEFTACFIYHHALGDGVSGLVFHNAFRNALVAACSTSSLYPETESSVTADEKVLVLPPVEDLHPQPLHPNPPGLGSKTRKEWTANSIRMPCKSRWASFCISPGVSQAFFRECKGQSTSVTAALSSMMASVLFTRLPETEDTLTCIIPVSLRPWLTLPRDVANDAIGTYFDATRVSFTRPDPSSGSHSGSSTDIWPGARQVSEALKDYRGNVSPTGEPYTAIAVLKTIPDFSVICRSMLGKPRDAAFEVTNVGVFSSSTNLSAEGAPLWQVGRVMLSRSALASGAAVTISIATGGNGSMTVGFSWQDGVVEDGIMDSILQGAETYFSRYQ